MIVSSYAMARSSPWMERRGSGRKPTTDVSQFSISFLACVGNLVRFLKCEIHS